MLKEPKTESPILHFLKLQPTQKENKNAQLRKYNIWNLENTYLRDYLAYVCSPR